MKSRIFKGFGSKKPFAMPTFALVTDLFFKAKIAETARQLGVEIVFAKNIGEIFGAKLVIVDLEKFGAGVVPEIKKANLKAKIVGYLSHVQVELKKQALENGCGLVLAKSEFSKRLAELLTK